MRGIVLILEEPELIRSLPAVSYLQWVFGASLRGWCTVQNVLIAFFNRLDGKIHEWCSFKAGDVTFSLTFISYIMDPFMLKGVIWRWKWWFVAPSRSICLILVDCGVSLVLWMHVRAFLLLDISTNKYMKGLLAEHLPTDVPIPESHCSCFVIGGGYLRCSGYLAVKPNGTAWPRLPEKRMSGLLFRVCVV